MKDKPRGFKCRTCRKFHAFGVYVAGHWDIPLKHTCDCGAEHEVLRGQISVLKNGRKQPDKSPEKQT